MAAIFVGLPFLGTLGCAAYKTVEAVRVARIERRFPTELIGIWMIGGFPPLIAWMHYQDRFFWTLALMWAFVFAFPIAGYIADPESRADISLGSIYAKIAADSGLALLSLAVMTAISVLLIGPLLRAL